MVLVKSLLGVSRIFHPAKLFIVSNFVKLEAMLNLPFVVHIARKSEKSEIRVI